MHPQESDPDVLQQKGDNRIEIADHRVFRARPGFHLVAHPVGCFDREPGSVGLMHPARVPCKAANNVAQVLDAVLSPFSLCIRHRDRDRQEQRRFRLHPVLGISRPRSFEEFFHPFAVFPDGDDERHPYPGQKPKHLPGIELPVQAENFHLEAEFGDPVEAPGDVPNLRGALTHRIHGQRHLPVSGGHVQGDVGIELIRRFLAFASDDKGFILIGGLP